MQDNLISRIVIDFQVRDDTLEQDGIIGAFYGHQVEKFVDGFLMGSQAGLQVFAVGFWQDFCQGLPDYLQLFEAELGQELERNFEYFPIHYLNKLKEISFSLSFPILAILIFPNPKTRNFHLPPTPQSLMLANLITQPLNTLQHFFLPRSQ